MSQKTKTMRNLKTVTTLFTLLFLCFTTQIFAQKEKNKINVPFDSSTQKYTYVKIVQVPNKSASDLYKSAKDWTKLKYADDKYLIDTESEQLNDLGNFTINVVMKGGLIKFPYTYTVIFNINLLFKDSKCRLEITNIKLSQNSQGTTSEQTMESFQKQMEEMGIGKRIAEGFVVDVFNEIDINMLKLITEIETSLTAGVKNKSDW